MRLLATEEIEARKNGGAGSGEDAERGREHINLMLKSWMRYEHLWRLTEGYVLLVADLAGYSLTPRPYRVNDIRYRDSNSKDTIMTPMSRDLYYTLPDKAITGIPTQWYFDPQRDSDSLFIWPVLSSINGTTPERIQVTYQRRFEDVDTLAENVDIPQQYLEVVGYNLASRLASSYGRKGDTINHVHSLALELKNEMLDDDRPDFVQFVPDNIHG